MSKKGVLLINLGSPDSPTVDDVRRYLREFLMDGRVLDAPWPVRFCIVNFAILPTRPRHSAEAYHKIWLAEGSPLIVTSRKVRDELQQRLDLPIALAMRYQNPSVESALAELARHEVDELLVIPLFPHYAMSSYESAVERVRTIASEQTPGLKITVLPPFFDHPDYIHALVASAEAQLKTGYDHLLFSFHGLPERHLRKSDPTRCHCLKVKNCCEVNSLAHQTCYRAQCYKTVKAFVQRAGVPLGKYSVAFQSRLGRDPWLQPYTEKRLEELAQSGVKKLLVLCPAFVTDCLETLEEIGLRGRQTFILGGGRELELIPCLNEHPQWLAALEKWILEFQRSGINISPVSPGNPASAVYS